MPSCALDEAEMSGKILSLNGNVGAQTALQTVGHNLILSDLF